MTREIALPRGAILLEEGAAGARSFSVGFWFPLGSRHEAPSERGFVHFVEHMVFKGSARRSAQDFAREVDRVGGYLNAFTERDTLCFHCAVPKAHWRLALDILVDLVFNAAFPVEEFERERQVIQSEILAAEDDPDEASHDAFLASIWPGEPMARKIAGEVEDLDKVSRDALFAFYRRVIVPSHLVVAVSGGESAADVAGELAGLLGGLSSHEMARLAYPAEPSPRFQATRRFEKAGVSQVFLYEASEIGGPIHADDYYALSAMNSALGESMSSRLFQGLRERQGLCYSVYSTFSVDRGVNLWMASASSSARNFPRLLESLDEELDRISRGMDGGFSTLEVEEAVSRLAGSFELALEDPEYRMKRLAKQRLCTGLALDIEETRARILAVDKRAVDDMAARVFGGARARFAWGKRTEGVVRAMEG